MATAREKRIKNMQESMDRLTREYDTKTPIKKQKRKTKVKKASAGADAPFSVFGLAGKIERRKARNRKSIQN